MKRLSGASGIIDSSKGAKDSEDKIVRNSILVHSGPNGTPVIFESADGEVKFDDARIQNIVKQHNNLIGDLAKGYGGLENMPVGAFPPILDMHESDSNDRIIGRLSVGTELRYEKRDVPGVGKNVSCVTGDLTFLGKNTVSKVNDGRIYHLSVGIHDKTDTLGELSTVIEPAAPGAMLLKKGNTETINIKRGSYKMPSKEDFKRLRKASEGKLVKLAALRDGLNQSKTKLVAANDSLKLTKKQGEIVGRLTRLMRSAKLTPAEFKKMDVKRLTALPEEHLETVLATYEVREPVINIQQKGSTDATAFGEMAKSIKKTDMKKLKSEIRGDLKKLTGGKIKLKSDESEDDDHGKTHEMKSHLEGGNKIETEHEGFDKHAVHGEMEQHLKHMAECAHHMEAGNLEEAKEAHMKAMACTHKMKEHLGEHSELSAKEADEKHLSADGVAAGDVKSEDYKQSMQSLQTQIDELNTQMARFAHMTEELMESEKHEGEEFEKMGEEHEQIGAKA